MSKYNIIDLFSGAGGMSLGFKKRGFNTLFAIEYNNKFASTYSYNFPKVNLIIEDIKSINDTSVKKLLNGEKVDIIVGGPPCQGFSKAGNIGRKFLEDERNELFKEFVRFVRLIKPKMFILENVASLKTHNKGKTLKEIIIAFSEIGYEVKHEVINSAEYGVPQERRRIFIVGTLGINDFQYPSKTKRRKTIKDAISDLPTLRSGEVSVIPNHNAMNHSDQMLHKMSFIKDGGNRDSIPENLRPKSGDIRKYIKYNSEKPSVCVTGDMRKIFHYEQNRALTARELARIQTFPDNFIFKGTSIDIQQQIGNAVPPLLASKFALNVIGYLDEL